MSSAINTHQSSSAVGTFFFLLTFLSFVAKQRKKSEKEKPKSKNIKESHFSSSAIGTFFFLVTFLSFVAKQRKKSDKYQQNKIKE